MQPPWEWTEVQLCKDIYHCRPSELAEEDWAKISYHLELLSAAAEVEEAQQASKTGGIRSGGL